MRSAADASSSPAAAATAGSVAAPPPSSRVPPAPIDRLIHPQHQFLTDTSFHHPVRPWHLAIGTGLLAFVLSLATFCWLPSTRASLAFFVAHLGLDASLPLLDIPWDFLLRVIVRLPGLTPIAWTGLLCAGLAAASVGLLCGLMCRVAYFYTPDVGPASIRREIVARRLAGVTAAAYLMVVFPFWWAGSHALPNLLAPFSLLLCAMLFSMFQRSGRLGWLAAFSCLWGLGCAWNIDYWCLSPLVLFLILREFFRWNAWRSPAAYLAVFLPGALGLSALVLVLQWAWMRGGALLYPTSAALFRAFVHAQAESIGLQVVLTPVLLLLVAVAIAPWWILFPLSRRSPWFYERGQILLRLLLLAHIFSLLFNVPYAPWRLLGGIDDPFLAPVLLLAACIGYMAGEFWCCSQPFPFKDSSRVVRIGKRMLAGLALLLAPACLLAGLAVNLPVVLRSRAGATIWLAANRTLTERDGRTIVFADPIFDDAITLAAYQRHEPVAIFRFPERASDAYLQSLARRFPDLAPQLVRSVPYPRLLASFLALPGAAEHAVFLPGPEYVRSLAAVAPRSFAWHTYPLDASPGAAAPPLPADLARRELPCYEELRAWREKDVPAVTIEAYCRQTLCALAARSANDLSLDLARTANLSAAIDMADLASALDPDNLAARLNATQFRELAAAADAPAHADGGSVASPALADWSASAVAPETLADLQALVSASLPASRRAWMLAVSDGLVAAPEAWLRAGLPWAISGTLPTLEDVLPSDASSLLGLRPAADSAARWFQCALGRIGTPFVFPARICAAMTRNPAAAGPLAELARTYLMQNRPDLAAAALDAALALLPAEHPGYPVEEILVDAALAGLLPGRFPPHRDTLDDVSAPPVPRYPRRWTSRALFPFGLRQALVQTASENPSDILPWLILWHLEPTAPAGRVAFRKLKTSFRHSPGLRLTMAAVCLQSTAPANARAAYSLLHPLPAELQNSPVAWRLLYDAASASDHPTAARLAYIKLKNLLPPDLFRSLGLRVPSRPDLFGTRLHSFPDP
ncbi:MAG: hypothetical protein IJT88_02495 [Kiritimatiellae bacterium]|nr:hypothetical protein [Kiritimatiellia bacterium]